MQQQLRRINPITAAKIMAAIYGCMALVIVPILFIAGLTGALVGPGTDRLGEIGGGLLVAIVIPAIYIGIGFLCGLIISVLYNFVAEKFGGIVIDLEPMEAQAAGAGQ